MFPRDAAAKFPLLTERARSLADFRPLGAAIRRAILPNGEVSDDASSELRRIRGGLARTRETIQTALERILHSRGAPPGEDYVTRRNDRFVIPVRASERRAVQGVVHAASATGQTVFVEPLETLELNNRLVQLSDEEIAEIARILEELTGRVVAEHAALSRAVETIAELDSLFARARFARDFDACMPVFADSATIALELARHPVLESTLRPQGRAVVPLTLALGGDETVLVISGPNTGGKTVALKTVGLAVLAAQSGIPVAAQSARLPIFDQVLADIGDEQSIAADLSTFSAHMLNLKSMLASLTERSLVLVDEMGTGTAPEEGAALAVALLDEFRARRCLVLATTHHDRLKAYASTTPGVLNASVEFDDVKLAPTYRLRVGVPGGSSGIAIARRLGLPEAIVERASALIAPEAREAAGLIAYLHRSRDAVEQMQRDLAEQSRRLEQERRALREEWVERQRKRIAELEQRVADALAQHERDVAPRPRSGQGPRAARATRKAGAPPRGPRALGDARRSGRRRRGAALGIAGGPGRRRRDAAPSRARRTRARRAPARARLLRAGGLAPPRRLQRRSAGRAAAHEGAAGRDHRHRCRGAGESGGGAGKRPGASPGAAASSAARQRAPERHHRARSGGVRRRRRGPDEINVIGCTVEEATRLVDKFLDTAALTGKPQVRIIHGHGTGALRRGLAEFFAAHPLVERIHAEADDRGGSAVTVVELKD